MAKLPQEEYEGQHPICVINSEDKNNQPGHLALLLGNPQKFHSLNSSIETILQEAKVYKDQLSL